MAVGDGALLEQLVRGVEHTLTSIRGSLATLPEGNNNAPEDWEEQTIEKVFEQKGGGKKVGRCVCLVCALVFFVRCATPFVQRATLPSSPMRGLLGQKGCLGGQQ